MQTLTRAGLLRRGAAAALAASGAGVLARDAAADVPPDADLAYARLLVAADLLAADFYAQALAANQFGRRREGAAAMRAFNEQEHYAAVAASSRPRARRPPPRTTSTSRTRPRRSPTEGSIAKLGVAIEQLQLGAYLGAADAVQSQPLRGIASRIAANEAQHLSLFTGLLHDRLFGVSLPLPLASATRRTHSAPTRAEEHAGQVALHRHRGRAGARHQRRHAAPLGPGRPDQDEARQEQPARRRRRRDRARARRRLAAPERAQPLPRHGPRGEARRPARAGRDDDHRAGAPRRDHHPRRGRGARPQARRRRRPRS